MLRVGVANGLPAPGSEVLSRLLLQVSETVQACRDVLVCRESFAQLSFYLEKLKIPLKEIQEDVTVDILAIRAGVESLEAELKNAKELIKICTCKSKFYLLVNCIAYVKRVQEITNALGRALSHIPLDSLDLSLKSKDRIMNLSQEMQVAQLKASIAEEDLVDEIESGIRDRRKGSDYANDLLVRIAKVAGVSLDRSTLKQEFDEFKREKESVELHKHQTEVLQLEQIISLLSCADAVNSVTQREEQYKEKRSGLGNDSLPPLQTFYCPITQDVMEDAVEISSGQTFERSAIQKWFADGHRVCPVTKIELESLALKPNRLLQQSIEEWKDRNTVIRLTAMTPKLRSENEEEVLQALMELQDLCEEKSVHRHWIAAEGLIPVVVGLLGSSKRNIRKKTLATLIILVANNDENKGRICDAGALAFAVRSLARDAGEARLAVALLLQLSRDSEVCEQISNLQGCILLLVTMTNSENPQAAEDAKELLKLLSISDQNVMHMAEVNYFKPLVQRLGEGSNITQILMANALARMSLTDQSRVVLVQQGVLAFLVRLASMGNLEAKSAALGAFRNLSILPENRDPMIEAGVMQPLLELLFTVKSVVATVREHAAATFANLAMASSSGAIRDLLGNLTQSDETIYQLLSLLNLTGPGIQGHILRALNCICHHSASVGVRTIMREGGAIQLLIHFCDAKDLEVRLNALKLLHCLTLDGGGDVLVEEMGQNTMRILVDLLSSPSQGEEKAAAMGILGNIPINNRQATERMLQVGVLSSIVTILTNFCTRTPGNAINSRLVENTTRTLIRFTLPTDLQLQQHTAKHNVIPLLVHLLSSGTPLSKCRAAMSLEQFSESTVKLSTHIQRSGGWFCCAPPPEETCTVHSGICSVEGTFCLVEADAVSALTQVLKEKDQEADEAALGALATLLYDECWEKGAAAIVQAEGIRPIIRLLTTGSPGVQEKALWILEKIFRKERYRSQYGSAAQMSLVSLTQGGTNATRPLAAKILAHLNILHDQSSYF